MAHWRALAKQAAGATIVTAGLSLTADAEVSLLLTGDVRMQALNLQWRHKDKPTNVLSFPAAPVAIGEMVGPMLGDIVIAFETVEREALQEGKSLDDHFVHLVVHSLLHLFGYDHETPADAERMEAMEIAILATLGIGDPYAEPAGQRLTADADTNKKSR